EWKEVETVTDQFVTANPGLPGRGNADDKIVLSRDVVKQRGEGGEQRGEKRAAKLRRCLLQPLEALRIERDGFHRSGVRFHARTRTIRREFEHRSAIREFRNPKAFRYFRFLAA